MAAPAVRVLVRERRAMPQAAALFERPLDVRVGIEHPLTGKQLHRVVEVSARPDRRVDLEAVLEAGGEVVSAVSRSRMDRAGAGVERDGLPENPDRVAGVQ